MLDWDWTRGMSGTGEWDGVYPDLFMEMDVGFLAESWEVPDDSTIVFHIRQGVYFQDKIPAYGRELDAEDVAYSMRKQWTTPTAYLYRSYPAERHLDMTLAGEDATDEEKVAAAIEVTDKYTVTAHSLPGLIGLVYDRVSYQWAATYARETADVDMTDWRNHNGTGVFIVSDYVPGSVITYTRNPNYWMKDPLHPDNQLPYIDGWKWLILPDASTRMAALRTGKLDRLGSSSATGGYVTYEDAAELINTNPELLYIEYESSLPVAISLKAGNPDLPWADVNVRRALAMAIDNDEIKDEYFGGFASILAWPVVERKPQDKALWMPLEDYPEDVQKLYGFYPEEAKQLMVDAGYPDGFQAEVITQTADIDMLSIVAAYWEKHINVTMDIQVREYAVYTSLRSYRNYEGMAIGSLNTTAMHLIDWQLDHSSNDNGITDPAGTNLYNANKVFFFDYETRIAKSHDVDTGYPYMLGQSWNIQLPNAYLYTFWQPWVKGYSGEYYTSYYAYYHWQKYLWIDQDLKEEMTGRR